MNNKQIKEAIEPFYRVFKINEPLNPDLKRPVRDFIPGVWPTMEELKKLVDVYEKLK